MPANGRWDLIRRLKVNSVWRSGIEHNAFCGWESYDCIVQFVLRGIGFIIAYPVTQHRWRFCRCWHSFNICTRAARTIYCVVFTVQRREYILCSIYSAKKGKYIVQYLQYKEGKIYCVVFTVQRRENILCSIYSAKKGNFTHCKSVGPWTLYFYVCFGSTCNTQ